MVNEIDQKAIRSLGPVRNRIFDCRERRRAVHVIRPVVVDIHCTGCVQANRFRRQARHPKRVVSKFRQLRKGVEQRIGRVATEDENRLGFRSAHFRQHVNKNTDIPVQILAFNDVNYLRCVPRLVRAGPRNEPATSVKYEVVVGQHAVPGQTPGLTGNDPGAPIVEAGLLVIAVEAHVVGEVG